MRKKFNKKEKAIRKHKKHLTAIEARNSNLISSQPKKIRLNKLAKQLNMSLPRIVKILEENGISVDANPNALINEDILQFLFDKLNQDDTTNILLTDPTYEILEWIRKDCENLNNLTPNQFEDLVIMMLTKKGFGIERSGKTNKADGGIDIIAYKKDIVNIIIAIQVKYKINTKKKISSNEVRDFVGAMKLVNYFNAGMLITNSLFTDESRWLEEKNQNLELKDSKDIQNWLKENFRTSKKIDKQIELTKHNNIHLKF